MPTAGEYPRSGRRGGTPARAARKSCRAKGLRGKAMKRWVRTAISELPAPKPADYEDALKECESEQTEDVEDFTAEHGDGPSGLA